MLTFFSKRKGNKIPADTIMKKTPDVGFCDNGQAMSDPSLTATFLSRVKHPERWRELGDLQARLTRLCEQGRARWPTLSLAPDRFIAHIAAVLSPADSSRAELSAMNATDLYLACACAEGVPGALPAFEQDILSHLPTYLSRLRPSPDFIEEIGQQVR